MPGSFDLDGYTPALSGPAMAVGVYLYDPDAEEPLSLLPNIWCLRIDYREGPEPPVARFRYILDGNMAINFGWPARIGDVWPIDAQGPYVVLPDDRLIVAAQNPDGSPLYLFDGFAQIPQAGRHPRTEDATFVAVGVAVRAWDDTIHTRIQRDADDPDDTSGESDFEVHLPCRFNPADQRPGSMGGYLGNSTPDALYTVPEGSNDGSYPVFVDPLLADERMTWSSRGTSRTRCSTCWPCRTRATITSPGHPAARSRICWRRWPRPRARRPSIPRRPSRRTA